MTTTPRRWVAPPSLSRWMARSHAARCESIAALRHAGRPAGEEDDARVLARTDPRRRGGRRARVPAVVGDQQGQAERFGGRAGGVLGFGMDHYQPRPQRLQRGDRLGLGEVGVDRGEHGARLGHAVPELERVERAPGPHHATRSSGATPSAPSRCAARLAPASSWAKVRASSPSVAPMRWGCTSAVRARRSEMRTSITRPPARAELAEPERALDLVALVLRALVGGHRPPGRAHGEDLDQREALARQLRAERLAEVPPRAGDAVGLVDRAPRHVGDAGERGHDVGHRDRGAVVTGGAALEAGLGALPDRRRRGHLAAGVAEHPVVEHEAGDRLAAAGGVQHLGEPFRDHVAVALQRVDGAIGEHALHPGGDGGGAPVQALQELDVGGGDDLRVAAVPDDADRPVDELELRQHLHQQPPGDRVPAPGAQVVLGALQQGGREVGDLPHGRGVGGIVHRAPSRWPRGCARGWCRRRAGRPGACPTRPGSRPRSTSHRDRAVHRDADVVEHLARVELVDQHLAADPRSGGAPSASAGNGHSVTGRNVPIAVPLGAAARRPRSRRTRRWCRTTRRRARRRRRWRPRDGPRSALISSYLSATCCQCRLGPGPGVLCLPCRQVQTTFDGPVPPLVPSRAQGLSGRWRRRGRAPLDRHLGEADHVVAVEDDRREPPVGQLERELGVLGRLDHAGGASAMVR